MKPNSRHLPSSIYKQNHKATNRQRSYDVIIDFELHKLYALQRVSHHRVNLYVNERVLLPRLT